VTLGLVQRVTRDVDVVALASGGELIPADPLPPALADALARVARDFGLQPDWLNAKPAGLLDFGLPVGFMSRVTTRVYGPFLTVHFASRLDQIHFKLYALVDNRAVRHEADLNALRPTRKELVDAARWARTHDPSDGFRQMLVATLAHLGVTDADVHV